MARAVVRVALAVAEEMVAAAAAVVATAATAASEAMAVVEEAEVVANIGRMSTCCRCPQKNSTMDAHEIAHVSAHSEHSMLWAVCAALHSHLALIPGCRSTMVLSLRTRPWGHLLAKTRRRYTVASSQGRSKARGRTVTQREAPFLL